jgi:hypothetical protein
MPKRQWKTARIIKVHPDDLGQVRTVTIKFGGRYDEDSRGNIIPGSLKFKEKKRAICTLIPFPRNADQLECKFERADSASDLTSTA